MFKHYQLEQCVRPRRVRISSRRRKDSSCLRFLDCFSKLSPRGDGQLRGFALDFVKFWAGDGGVQQGGHLL